ncbi:hypothetical protein [Ideonella sp.]|uniref:hypothetical protein n=1 Tax=Ideonella sp. TaxID=1929293 RepID=UPI002B4A7113|nr:hypothetical protein [Ideonella sp.]HJV69722.1 hypothetical protein [Ideonella sp.]
MHCISEDTRHGDSDDGRGQGPQRLAGAPFSHRGTPWAGIALLCSLVVPAGWIAGCATREPAPAPAPAPVRPVAPMARPAPSPGAARNWDEFRLRAAQKLVAANPGITYTGSVPEPLLAIPVLSVELNADGSVARIDVMRHPSQAKDTTQIAIDAVRRAAPFGDVSRLPRPWKYVETFLFDEERKFKPVTLDR